MLVERYGDPTPREQPNLESFEPEGDLILAVKLKVGAVDSSDLCCTRSFA